MGKSSWCKKLILFPLNFGPTSSGNRINLANHHHHYHHWWYITEFWEAFFLHLKEAHWWTKFSWPQFGKIEETDFFVREDRLTHCMGEICKALKKKGGGCFLQWGAMFCNIFVFLSLLLLIRQAHALHGWNLQSLEKRVELVFAMWHPCPTSQSLSRQNAIFFYNIFCNVLQCFCSVFNVFSPNVLQLCWSLF